MARGADIASRRTANGQTGALIGGGIGLAVVVAVGLTTKPKSKR
ncbi:MAG: hypothetical protein QM770_13110 [Tepidisphaeraceae bacterium]